MSLISLRPSSPTDIPKFMAMEQHPANADFVGQSTEAEHKEIIQQTNAGHLSIYNFENELVGFILLQHLDTPIIELKRIIISEKGKGYGKASMEWIKKEVFKQAHVEKLWLDVFDSNQRALHIYQKAGFNIDTSIKPETTCCKKDGQEIIYLSIKKQP